MKIALHKMIGWRYENARLFPRDNVHPTEPLTPSQLYHWFNGVVELSGIRRAAHVTDHIGDNSRRHANIHQFRHRLVTMLLEYKENRLMDVSAFLGHRHVATTIDPFRSGFSSLHARLGSVLACRPSQIVQSVDISVATTATTTNATVTTITHDQFIFLYFLVYVAYIQPSMCL